CSSDLSNARSRHGAAEKILQVTGNIYVRRGDEEDIAGDLLKISADRICCTGNKINDPLSDLKIHSFKIEDHCTSGEKRLCDLSGVIYRSRLYYTDLHIARPLCGRTHWSYFAFCRLEILVFRYVKVIIFFFFFVLLSEQLMTRLFFVFLFIIVIVIIIEIIV